MVSMLSQVLPALSAPLDDEFRPASLAYRAFEREAAECEGPVLELALEREDQRISRFALRLLPAGHPAAAENTAHADRALKFLLWQRGAWRVFVAGPRSIGEALSQAYRATGTRAFDAEFMARVYGRDRFSVQLCDGDELPAENDPAVELGGHLGGCRIGFDAGGSDRKVAAVVDGQVRYSSEVVWHPKQSSDPLYHIAGIRDSLRLAAEHMPRVDALGVSSAGIYIKNQTRVASLFRQVGADDFETHIRDIYIDFGRELGVPLAVANDGDVAALAGSLSLGKTSLLGLAFGTSLAAGYVDRHGRITGWLNELAFAPIDYSSTAVRDVEWSNDRGVGSSYLSQDGAIRLAEKAGLKLPTGAPPAELLGQIQQRLATGDERCRGVYETLGVYLGYALLHYATFYRLEHVLLLGRLTSGPGGEVMLERGREVLRIEADARSDRIELHLPDESSRRVGQSVAAASLPRL